MKCRVRHPSHMIPMWIDIKPLMRGVVALRLRGLRWGKG
jgi:hypothetical protein